MFDLVRCAIPPLFPSAPTAFQERLFALKAVGHDVSIELAESDLVAIGVVLRDLATVLEGFEK